MVKRVQAPRVKAAVQDIVTNQGDNPISVEIISQRLRESYADAIESDRDDLVSYGLGVAIGRISSRPVQDAEIRDLFGGGTTHEMVNLRGAEGGKVHITRVTAPLWMGQPARSRKANAVNQTQDKVFDDAAREMIAAGVAENVTIVEYLKSKQI